MTNYVHWLDQAPERNQATSDKIAGLEKENSALRAALKEYGRHKNDCYMELKAEPCGCDCGLHAAMGIGENDED